MRNRTLHALLETFTEESGLQLAAETANGAEVPFEVIEERGARSPLYCYRPLTGQFIRSRMGLLDRLPSYLPAARAVAGTDGIERYLRRRGEPRIPPDGRERADAVLRSFLSAVYAEATAFGYQPEAFAAAYLELEAALYEGRQVATVVVPVHGLALESDEVALGDGLSLVRGDALPDAPAEAVWADEDTALAVFTSESERVGGPAPLAEAAVRFRALLRALRLFDAGDHALGPLAWARVDGGAWQAAPLGGSSAPARAVRERTQVPAAQEDELRAFCSLVARRTPRAGEVAWALSRFELGCERADPFEALTDHLLALRALLEPEGPESGRLAQRLAAICAVPDERAALTERIARAVTLERTVVAGVVQPGTGAERLVAELAGHLRALLRDVLCGHLDADLRALADELLEEAAAEPVG
jgi:hypothetical protein